MFIYKHWKSIQIQFHYILQVSFGKQSLEMVHYCFGSQSFNVTLFEVSSLCKIVLNVKRHKGFICN